MVETNLKINKIEDSFVETLTDSDIQQLFSNVAEFSIDSVLDQSLLRDIPIISTITSLVKTGLRVREMLFAKKNYPFFTAD